MVVGVDRSNFPPCVRFRTGRSTTTRRAAASDVCWQLKDLGVIPGYENAVAPVKVGQRRAEEILSELMAKARIPDGVKVSTNAFHIPASKGLIAASRYASHLVVGSRGLSGLDAHFLGSVSRQIVNFAECTVTVVH